MTSLDFWRLPVDASVLSESDAEPSKEKKSAPGEASVKASFAPPVRSSQQLEPVEAAPKKPVAAELRWRETSTSDPHRLPKSLDDAFRLDDAFVASMAGCPVKLGTLAGYLSSLSAEADSSACPGVALGEALAARYGRDAVPSELSGLSGPGGSAPADSATLKSLCRGSAQVPIDKVVSGPIRGVPPLPIILTLADDVPRLLEEMLCDIPVEERDTKKFFKPEGVEPFPSLSHGMGGILPSHTPKEAAQNALAAAILSRFCGNVLTVLSDRTREAREAVRKSPEEKAFEDARETLREATASVREAKLEEQKAESALRDYHARGELDMDVERDLQSRIRWKSAVCKQMQAELADAERMIRQTEAAWKARRGKGASAVWHSTWESPLPRSCASEPLFGVRLVKTSPINYTIKNFMEAMQNGFVDRQAGSVVPKHIIEVVFVRHAADSLMLCRRSGEECEELSQYTHLPAPATVATGLLDLEGVQSDDELRVVRPHHGQMIRLQGPMFSFAVLFTSVPGAGAQFLGMGTHALANFTPWNQIEFCDMLWQQEAVKSMVAIPTIAALAAVVWDPSTRIGILPPLRLESEGEVPFGSSTLAMLQASLFGDVKMWPVALPDAARVRWDYALRALHHALVQRRGLSEESPLDEELDDIRDEVLPQCLRGLPKVPNDAGAGDAYGCRGLGDRVKRMEMSALHQSPLASASALRRQLDALAELWPDFARDCAVEP